MTVRFEYEIRAHEIRNQKTLFIEKYEDEEFVTANCIPNWHNDYRFAIDKISKSTNIQETLAYLDSVL